jgi:hypothetical protein
LAAEVVDGGVDEVVEAAGAEVVVVVAVVVGGVAESGSTDEPSQAARTRRVATMPANPRMLFSIRASILVRSRP